MLELSSDEAAHISELLTSEDVPFHMPCGGRGSCLKCKVLVFGDVLPPSEYEKSLLTDDELNNGIRFACMASIKGKATLKFISEQQNNNLTKIITSGIMPEISLRPWSNLNYGIAVDIGTTTVAIYLYNLKTGANIDTLSCVNPQGKFGADVITRVDKSLSGLKKELSAAIVNCLNEQINKITVKNKINIDEIGGIVIAGNTAMMYLLCGCDTSSIAKAPFLQDRYFGEFTKPSSLGLHITDKCGVYLVRSISSYVGGDITAALIASELGENKILADIGTNGEMVLVYKDRLLCCSTAAGPVFEGAGIHQGMTAKEGAIYKVTIINGTMMCSVIGNKKASGICGSGIIDAVAAMLDLEIIDETGRFCNDEDYYILPGTDIHITQDDIRKIQLAKSAICAGLETLIHKAGLPPENIEELIVAGGFGNNINIASAERIGLIPKSFSNKTKFIGNAAGIGASMILLDHSKLILSEELSKKAETIELSTDKFFMDRYIEGMYYNSFCADKKNQKAAGGSDSPGPLNGQEA